MTASPSHGCRICSAASPSTAALPDSVYAVNRCVVRVDPVGDALADGHVARSISAADTAMIRKLASGGYRLYSRKVNPRTGRRRNLGTFRTRAGAEKHERAVQFFKRHG